MLVLQFYETHLLLPPLPMVWEVLYYTSCSHSSYTLDDIAREDLTPFNPLPNFARKTRDHGENVPAYVLDSLTGRLAALCCFWAYHRITTIICNRNA